MSNRTNFYINGEWIAPSTSDTIDVINPATEQSIGQVAMGGAADVDKAVAAAKAPGEGGAASVGAHPPCGIQVARGSHRRAEGGALRPRAPRRAPCR